MDDKKKTLIVGVLFVVVVLVGTFQFMSSGTPPPPHAATEEKKPQATAAKDVKPVPNPLFAADLAVRDPFKGDDLEKKPDPIKDPLPAPTTKRGDHTTLPPAFGGPGRGDLKIAPVKPPEPVFGYALAGVILGDVPAAVFIDSQGGEKLVRLGGQLDPETQVIEIEKGHVSVRFNAHRLTLSIGGNGSGK